MSWTAASGVLDHYELYENGAGIYNTTGLTASISGRSQGNFTYAVRACNSAGCSAFTPNFVVTVVPPTIPGAIAGPSNSTTGAYTLSWGASTGSVSQYSLYENGVLYANTTALSAAVSGRGNGTYAYKVQACGAVGCGGFTADFTVTVLFPPGAPGSIAAPTETGPSYTVSWGAASGTVARYDLDESFNGGAWTTTAVTATSYAFTNRAYGSYGYRVRACNASGCSGYVSASVTVTVITGLSTFPDSNVPTQTVPTSAWVGTIPGTAGTEGGAATYNIPIEIPPGRAGMQPQVALSYSSRNGNGVAGVGWALSAAKTIYRCPRTLAQEGAGRTVQHDLSDRLCFGGQRLVTNGTYGVSGSEYRTEIEQFDKITLIGGDMNSWSSYIQVEHKSGRISQFEPAPLQTGSPPDVWYLAREYDRQNNCIIYNYTAGIAPRYTPNSTSYYDQDRELSSIVYTGTGGGNGTYTQRQCTIDSTTARSIVFNYSSTREDIRTTFQYGVGTIMGARLDSISTMVGSQAVRLYQLSYHLSGSTRRSLLDSVTLCAGATCGTSKLPPTTFSYEENTAPGTSALQHFDLWHADQGDGVPLGADWRTLVVGDLDGDGKRELSFANDTGTSVLKLSTCPSVTATTNAPFWLGFDNPMDDTPLASEADVNRDGRVDAFGTQNGFLAFATANCSSSTTGWTITTTDLGLNLIPSANNSAGGIDYDGDGIIDARSVDATSWAETIYLHKNKDWTKWAGTNNIPIAPPPAPNTYLKQQMTQDLNGDGMVDTSFDDNINSNTEDTQVSFFTGLSPANAAVYSTGNLSTFGGPTGNFKVSRWRRWIDVNGDGLSDIYDPPYIYINRGGPPGSNLFQRVAVSYAAGVVVPPSNRTVRSFVMDVDSDGRDELMVPATRTYDACYNDPTHKLPSGDPISFCGADFDVSPGSGYADQDRSVFMWNAYKFVEMSDGSYTVVMVPTNLQAPVNYQLGKNDSNGDGTVDVYFRFHNTTGISYNAFPAGASGGPGPYIARNFARAPDLLTGVTNGLGATAAWRHRPLSDHSAPTDQAIGCDMPEPFYVAHLDGARSADYAYFASSMWTVARFDTDNGIGAGMNKTCYRYQDAMLNMEGRGFQGFKVIVGEEQMPVAAGEDEKNLAGCGGTCSPNNLRTTTEFYQEFPLAGKQKTTTVAFRSTGAPLSQTSFWWHTTPSTFGAWLVYSSATDITKYEIAGPVADHKTTVSEIDVLSGEPSKSCAIDDATLTGLYRQETNQLVNDTSVWWLGKPTSRAVVNDFWPLSLSPLNQVPQLTGAGAWAGRASPPTCPSPPAQAPKTQTSNYVWYPASGNVSVGYQRKLNYQDVVLADNSVEAHDVFTYDAVGNILTMLVHARDALDATTSYTYSADSYFRVSETDPLQHTASRTFDPATGLVTSSQAVQGGPNTTFIYDALGRLQTTQTSSSVLANPQSVTQPTQQVFLTCTAGSNCALREQTFQVGARTKTVYKDRLGRVIAAGTEGFDGLEIIARVDYNERGIKIKEYQPVATSGVPGQWNGTTASPYTTSFSHIDALGRPGAKTVLRNANLFRSGSGDASLTTSYVYSIVDLGLRADISVPKAAAVGGALTMSRTYDRRGKLVQTVQRVSVPTAHDITTSYSYDPAGNLTVISDTKANQIASVYDDLNRKRSVTDPDRGKWTYTWDGGGRVRSQTDAKGLQLTFEYDAAARLVKRYMKAPSDSAPVLEANWVYDANNAPGTLGSLIGVADGFRRDYKYDSMLRPWSINTHVPADIPTGAWNAQDFVVEYGYDHNYGRVKAMKYPSGEIVGFNYDTSTRGSPLGESQMTAAGATLSVYRTINAMSERDQVTAQTFGNGINETDSYDDSTGMPLIMNAYGLKDAQPAGCSNVLLAREVDYLYDQFLNVASQSKQFLLRDPSTKALVFSGCTPAGVTATETYQYDELQRLLSSSRSWTGMPTPGAPTTPGDSYSYDDLGNILSKSDYGDNYTYGSNPRGTDLAGPHAVTSVSMGTAPKPAFSYDANGNMTAGDGRGVTFDNLDRPTLITLGAVNTRFQYAPDGERYVQRTSGGSAIAKTVFYVGKLYERFERSGTVEEKTYVGPDVVIFNAGGSSRDIRYLHLDRLGSVDSVTTGSGQEFVPDTHSYDAFGKPRARDLQTNGEILHSGGDPGTTTNHGFTGHEHLDDTFLIHMNGRVYDYRLGRFLSVDPIISNPANSQSINPYSYIGNNPLSGVDPTGYATETKTPEPLDNEMVRSRTLHSILGRAGENATTNGIDQDSHAVRDTLQGVQPATPSTSNGVQPSAPKQPQAPVSETGSPTHVAQNDDKKGIGDRITEWTTGLWSQFKNHVESHQDELKGEVYSMLFFGLVNQQMAQHLSEEAVLGERALVSTVSSLAAKGGGLPGNGLVCRGGTCTAARFAQGSGVTVDANGRLQGVSVNSAAGATVEQLTSTIPNRQVGVTTVDQIRAAGGRVTPSPTANNPFHCTLCGLTPAQAEQLFTPTIRNPNVP